MKIQMFTRMLAIAALLLTGTASAQTWYGMAKPGNPDQAYDVAVGYDNDVYIINNAYDVYKWRWKNATGGGEGYNDYTNPSGGAWVKLGRPPSGASRITASEFGGLYAVAGDSKVYFYNMYSNVWVATSSPAGVADIAFGLDGALYAAVQTSSGFFSYQYTGGGTWTRFNPNREGIRIATSHYDWNKNWPIVSSRDPGDGASYYIPGVSNPFNGSWTAVGSGGELTVDYGGVMDKDPSGQSFELWRVGKFFNTLYRCPTYGSAGPNNCNWVSTGVTAMNVAVSRWNNVVIRTTPTRQVYISFDFRRQ